MENRYVIRPEHVTPYSPANHTGTRNYRMVAPGVNGAQFMEIIYGDIERQEGAVAHAHPANQWRAQAARSRLCPPEERFALAKVFMKELDSTTTDVMSGGRR